MSEDVHAENDNVLEHIAAVVSAVQDHVNTEEKEQIAAVVAATASMIDSEPKEGLGLGLGLNEKEKIVVSSQWAFPYFDFDTYKKEKLAHLAECRANKIPSHECDDVAMFDEIANATKMAQEYHDFFESQPGYETYLADLGEYYSVSGDKDKQAELAKKFHEKYPSALLNIVGENQPMYITNPLVAHYYRSKKGVSFADPATFGKDAYGKSILQANANLLKKIAHPELITNTQVASAYLASLWACAGNPLATDDPRCAVSSIYSELIDYYRSKHADYKERKGLSELIPITNAAHVGLPALLLRPPPPRPCDIQAESPSPSVVPAVTSVVPAVVPALVPAVVPSSPSIPSVPAVVPASPASPSIPSVPAVVPSVAPSVVPSVVPAPLDASAVPAVPSAPAAVPAPNLILQADARILSRIRHAPILTKGFGFPIGGRYLIPAPGFGTGIVV